MEADPGSSSFELDGSSGFVAKINFQPAGVPVPAGYLPDTGASYGDRGNGFTYGWSLENTSQTRDRNATSSPDQRYDTLIHFQRESTPTWEIAVPNGTYTVHMVSGDPSWFDSTYAIDAEGSLALSGTPTSASPWVQGTKTVSVTDGRLTISNASGSLNNKLCFIEIAGVEGDGGTAGSGGSSSGGSSAGGSSSGGSSGGSGGSAAPAAAISAKINFQPAGSPVPSGYVADTGAAFGNRGNGWSYGWDIDNSAQARDRNAANSPDDRYDTLSHLQLQGSRKWELTVPNGNYTVHVVAGDPVWYDSVYRIDVEGQPTVAGTPTSSAPWVDGTRTVAVADGRLTISNGSGATNNKINFIEVASATGGTGGTGSGGTGGGGTGGTGGSGNAGSGGTGGTNQTSYTTNFNLNEQPISESGKWHHTDPYQSAVRTLNGLAYGTQNGTEAAQGNYNDSSAFLTGFPASQKATAVIHRTAASIPGNLEVELLLRWSEGPEVVTQYGRTTSYGYEINIGQGIFGTFVQIGRWKRSNLFNSLDSGSPITSMGVHDGDVFSAQIEQGSPARITVSLNNTVIASATDDTSWLPAIGSPGIGFFRRDSPGPVNPTDFCFTSFTAQGL